MAKDRYQGKKWNTLEITTKQAKGDVVGIMARMDARAVVDKLWLEEEEKTGKSKTRRGNNNILMCVNVKSS